MKLYKFEKTKNVASKYSLSIDPGIKTSGLCLLNLVSSEVFLKTIELDVKTNVQFPELLVLSHNMINHYFDWLKQFDIDLKYLDLILEFTFLQGSFSPSLNTQISLVVESFVAKNVNSITLFPPQIPGFFLRTTEKIDQELINEWIKYYASNYFDRVDSAHSADALMANIYVNHEYYQKRKLIKDIRIPDKNEILHYDMEKIKWQKK